MVVLLSLATVTTAWCGYQSARWSGEQTKDDNQASAARVMSDRKANEAVLTDNLHIGLFVQYIAAKSSNNQALSDFLYQRFPKELRVATDAWLATQSLTSPQAAPS